MSPRAITTVMGKTRAVRVPMVTRTWPARGVANAPAPAAMPVPPLGHFPGFAQTKSSANSRLRLPSENLRAPRALEPQTLGISLAPASVGTSFDGATESNTPEIPPDPNSAAGPSDVVEVVNSLAGIYDKSGNLQGSFNTFANFFAGLKLNGSMFDPRILYDSADNRFLMTVDQSDFSTNAHVLIAVSQTSDPTGAWNEYAISVADEALDGSGLTFGDFPTLGLSPTAIYISTGQFGMTTNKFSHTDLRVVGLAALLSGSATLNITTFKNVLTAAGQQAFAIEGALTYGTPSDEFLVAADFNSEPSSTLNLFAVNTSGTPSLSAMNLAAPSYSTPPDAPQPGTTRLIATNDFRVLNTVWSNDALWCAQAVASPDGSAVVARWYEINLTSLATASLADSGTVVGSGDTYFPAITVRPDGEADLAFSTSSPAQFVSAGFTGRSPSDGAGTTRSPILYQAGTADWITSALRWGDYSGMALDPDGGSSWATVEIAGSPDPHFVTSIAQILSLSDLTVAPVESDFGEQNLSVASSAATVTLTNNGAGTISITAAGLGGSDPGDFSIASDACSGTTLSADGSCAISVVFTPAAAGSRSAFLSASDSDASSPQFVLLSGTGIIPAVVLKPQSLTFVMQPTGTASAAQTSTLTNQSSAPLAISSLSAGADFPQSNTCGATVAPFGTCVISVAFAPALPGTIFGAVTAADNGPASPQLVNLKGTDIVPVAVTPASESFGAALAGTTSATKSVTLANNQAATLSITSIAPSTDFAVTGTTCGSALAAKSSCTISVTFTPRTSGTINGSLAIADSAATSPQLVALTGSGLAAVTLSPLTLNFGTLAVGTTSGVKTATLANNLSTSLAISSIAPSGDFHVSSTTCGSTLAAKSSCTISVTFSPALAETVKGAVTVSDNAPGSPQVLNLEGAGSGTSSSPVTLTPSSLFFATQLTGTTSPAKTVTLANNQSSALIITGLASSGDFGETNTCGASVPPSGSCTITVTFTPSGTGSIFGAVTIADSAGTSPQLVNLSGTGVPPVAVSPPSELFGGVVVGTTSAAKTLTLTNNLTTALAIAGIAPTEDFHVSATTCGSSLAARSSCTVSVSFSPKATGPIDGSLTITDSASNSPQLAGLTGSGLAPVVLSPSTLNFGTLAVGTTSGAKTVTLTNNLSTSLAISSVAPSGDFHVSSTTCGSALAEKSSCAISVTFTANIKGAVDGSLTITDAASNSPQLVSLLGSGF